jgi:hypothetical protein
VEGRGGVRRRRLRSPSSREGSDEGGLSSFDLIRVQGGISAKHSHIDPMNPRAPFCQDAQTLSPPPRQNEEGARGEEIEAAACETKR